MLNYTLWMVKICLCYFLQVCNYLNESNSICCDLQLCNLRILLFSNLAILQFAILQFCYFSGHWVKLRTWVFPLMHWDSPDCNQGWPRQWINNKKKTSKWINEHIHWCCKIVNLQQLWVQAMNSISRHCIREMYIKHVWRSTWTRQSKLCGFCIYLPRILNLWTFVVNFMVKCVCFMLLSMFQWKNRMKV